MCKEIIHKTGRDIIGPDLVALLEHFGLDALRKSLVSMFLLAFMIGDTEVNRCLIFMDQLGDAPLMNELLQAKGTLTSISQENATIILDWKEKYNLHLSSDFTKSFFTAILKSTKQLQSVLNMAERINDSACYQILLGRAWATGTYRDSWAL